MSRTLQPPFTCRDNAGEPTSTFPWTGLWVSDRLDLTFETTAAPLGIPLDALVGLAVRRNPRRAHLLVSTVLGKHVPTDPRLVHGAGLVLGELVRMRLLEQDTTPPGIGAALRAALAAATSTGSTSAVAALPAAVAGGQPAGVSSLNYPPAVVLGFAETATALGHSVADALRIAGYLHSTRRRVPGLAPAGGFEEEHSHATSHVLLPQDPSLLAGPQPLVLVDDELSTGTTALNTITALHRLSPRPRYVIAALVDLRDEADRDRMDRVEADLGTRIDVVALAGGTVHLPVDILTRGQQLVSDTDHATTGQGRDTGHQSGTHLTRAGAQPVRRVELSWPDGLPETARHGVTPAERHLLEEHLPSMAATLSEALGLKTTEPTNGAPAQAHRVLVLGVEELMYAPLRLAGALADLLERDQTGVQVRFSTTTRSPVLAVDEPGYAIRSRLVFPAHDEPADGPGPRFAYNVAAGADLGRRFDTVVLVVDDAADTDMLAAPDGLLEQLRASGATVLLAVLPTALPCPNPSRCPGGHHAERP